MQITTVGLDLAKHIFQVHVVDTWTCFEKVTAGEWAGVLRQGLAFWV